MEFTEKDIDAVKNSVINGMKMLIADTVKEHPNTKNSKIIVMVMMKIAEKTAKEKIKKMGGSLFGRVCGTYCKSVKDTLIRIIESKYSTEEINELVSYCVTSTHNDVKKDTQLLEICQMIPKLHINWNYNMIRMWKDD